MPKSCFDEGICQRHDAERRQAEARRHQEERLADVPASMSAARYARAYGYRHRIRAKIDVKKTMTGALAKYSLPGTYVAHARFRAARADARQAVARRRVVVDAGLQAVDVLRDDIDLGRVARAARG